MPKKQKKRIGLKDLATRTKKVKGGSLAASSLAATAHKVKKSSLAGKGGLTMGPGLQ